MLSALAGTTNYKRKYEPDFPNVKIIDASPGRVATPAAVESCGILVPPEPTPAVIPLRSHWRQSVAEGKRTWPDYQRCLTGAPPKREGSGPDRSMADFVWCARAAQRGWSVVETAEKLMEVSARAQDRVRLRDEGYALSPREMPQRQQREASRGAGVRGRRGSVLTFVLSQQCHSSRMGNAS